MARHLEVAKRPKSWSALLGLACLILCLSCLAAPSGAWAAEDGAPQGPAAPLGDDHWFLAPKVKRLVRSYTSFQFGNPLQHQLNPLSRLEFPLNSWWGGVNLGVEGPRYRLEVELLAALPGQDDIGVMRDSDWEEPDHPQVTTTYSETTVKLKDSFNLDGRFSMSLRNELSTPAWLDLRPLFGVRWQRYVFVTRDGVQQTLENDGSWSYEPLRGETLWFRQQYLHAYLGLMLTADLGRLGLGKPGHGWRVSLQGDLAHVWGENRDRHLLRQDRVTTERTEGYAWHAALNLRAPLGGWGALVMSADYMYIQTKGDHTLDYPSRGINYTFDYGVKVWSQQIGLSLSLEVPF
jgi:hypothetical protein